MMWTDPVRTALAARGGRFVDLPALLPAAEVLELAGEDLRARLFFASGPDGREMCLRADLTIPAALSYIASARQASAAVWLHEGKVFRAPRAGEAGGSEFIQIGLERYGDADPVSADCDVVLAALEACAAGGIAMPVLTLADGDLIGRVLAAAPLPEPWAQALRAEAGRPAALHRRLAEAAGEIASAPSTPFALALTRLDAAEATAAVEEVLALSRLTLGPGRNASDVAHRLVAKAERAGAPPLPPALVAAIRALLDVSGPARAAVGAAVGAAHRLGVDLTDWAQGWAIRLDALAAAAPGAASAATFRAGRRRNFAYYSGLFFDVAASPDAEPAASGGRYDRLIHALSAGRLDVPAVGCVVRPQRLPAHMEAK
jgi:ATP phosphoribosyltransferase regulatory subunit